MDQREREREMGGGGGGGGGGGKRSWRGWVFNRQSLRLSSGCVDHSTHRYPRDGSH